MKTVSFHSFRGGSGKTLLATDIAYWLAHNGKRVLLVDADFRAPSVHDVVDQHIPAKTKKFLQTYLTSATEVDIKDIINQVNAEGTRFDALLCGYSPDVVDFSSLLAVIASSRNQANQIMERFRNLFLELESIYGYHYAVVDMTPGWTPKSIIIAIMISDVLIEVIRNVAIDYLQSRNILLPKLRKRISYKTKKFHKMTEMNVVINEIIEDILPTSKYRIRERVIGKIPFDPQVRGLKQPALISVAIKDCKFSNETKNIAKRIIDSYPS